MNKSITLWCRVGYEIKVDEDEYALLCKNDDNANSLLSMFLKDKDRGKISGETYFPMDCEDNGELEELSFFPEDWER